MASHFSYSAVPEQHQHDDNPVNRRSPEISTLSTMRESIPSGFHDRSPEVANPSSGTTGESRSTTPSLDGEKSQRNLQKPRSIWLLVSNLFIWEVLAMLLSTVTLVAIIIILAHFNRQPQPLWDNVSLNSLISWLSTISKGCVLYATKEGLGQLKWAWFAQKTRPMTDLRTFDEASRGIYGSAELIWTLRAKHLAAFGSLAVILALAFDPFTQNLVHYYSDLVNDPSQTANLSYNSEYDTVGLSWHTNAHSYVDLPLKSNVYNALFNSDPSTPWSTPQYTCSSGNCTWDPIATLEVSASCTNITEYLMTFCHNVDDDDDSEFQGLGLQECSVVLPSENPVSASFVNNTANAVPVSVGSGERMAYENASIAAIQMIAQDKLIAGSPFGSWKKWQAMECALFPTVRSFRAKVTRGVYHEETLAVWKNSSLSYEPQSGTGQFLHPPWGPDMGMKPNTSFMASGPALSAIADFLGDLFAGHAQVQWRFGLKFHAKKGALYAGTDLVQAIAFSNITGCTVNTAEKLQCAMDNAAKAITKTFRDTKPSGPAAIKHREYRATGQAMTNTVHIAVHWQWIVVPALVWLLGIVTLIGTIWKSRQADVPTWKTDLIPLLFLYKDAQETGVPSHGEPEDSHIVRLYEIDDRVVLGR